MPNYQAHLLLGFISFVLVLSVFSSLNFTFSGTVIAVCFVACLLASVFPDIDQKNSKVYRAFRATAIILISAWITAVSYKNLALMFLLLGLWIVSSKRILLLIKPKHRGIMHSYKICLVFSLSVAFISLTAIGSSAPGIFAFFGYVSHKLSDKLFN